MSKDALPHLRLVPTPEIDPVEEALVAAQSIRPGNLDLDTATKLDRTIRALVKASRTRVKCAS